MRFTRSTGWLERSLRPLWIASTNICPPERESSRVMSPGGCGGQEGDLEGARKVGEISQGLNISRPHSYACVDIFSIWVTAKEKKKLKEKHNMCFPDGYSDCHSPTLSVGDEFFSFFSLPLPFFLIMIIVIKEARF